LLEPLHPQRVERIVALSVADRALHQQWGHKHLDLNG
jgi:hypothetical protein